METNAVARTYGRTRQGLHWVGALLILAMIPTGLVMARTLDDGLRLTLYQAHVVIGWTLVALAIWRLALRIRTRVPAPDGLAGWNRSLLHATHWGIAIFPLLLAVSGVGTMLQNDLVPLLQAGQAPPATLDAATARTGHQIGSYLFTALLIVHVAGIVRHQTRYGGALAPMVRGRR